MKKKKSSLFRKFVSYYRPHRRLFALTLIGAFFMALLTLMYPFLARLIIDEYINDIPMELVISGILLFCYVLRAFLSYNVSYWGHILGVRIQGDMRSDLFAHLEKLPFKYYDENRTGWIMTRLTNDLFEIGELAHHLPEDIFISSVTLTGALIILATFNPFLTLILFSILPFMILFAVLRRKKMRAAFRESREKVAEINAGVESSISGIRMAKAYTAADKEIEKFEEANISFQRARGKALKNMAIFFSGMGFFNNLLYLAAILGGSMFFVHGLITAGQFTAFMLFIGFMIQPISMFVGIFEQVQDGVTGFGRFQEIMAVPTEDNPIDPIEIDSLKGDIEFKNISFSYKSKHEEGQTKVIKNLSLSIKEGQTVAFVGPSGGGKTTLCHLIPRFYEADDGLITIGGVDITRIRREKLRKGVGIVAQDVFLFSGSIKDNIGYGDLSANFEQIVEAAKKADIHSFVMSLPDEYDTQVGERGVKLSGGQKQRISIARAFLKNPPILILDEATSALDNVSEMQIQASLLELSKGRTTIVVAHRLSTIKNSDMIFVLSQDGIIEEGKHDELINKNGFYSYLYSFYAS